jgi:hypothetical protein
MNSDNVKKTKGHILGLVGATGSGKTTLAKQLVAEHSFCNIHMGRPLKNMLLALGLTEQDVSGTPEQRNQSQALLGGKSTRYALKTLGTDWGRNLITPNLWSNAAKLKIEQQLITTPEQHIVIDDLRFPSDWQVIEELGGIILTVRRPEIEPCRRIMDIVYHRFHLSQIFGQSILGWQPLHETEFHWRDAPCRAEIYNQGTIEELANNALNALR